MGVLISQAALSHLRRPLLCLFTDLDGSLTGEGYGYPRPLPTLDRLRRLGAWIVPTTAKTKAEVEPLRQSLGLDGPSIVECGAAIHWPTDGKPRPPLVLGKPYLELRLFLESQRRRFHLRGFGDLDLKGIMEWTHLGPDAAARSRKRDYSEPFLSTEPEGVEVLARMAERRGFRISRGKRFFYLTGKHSKGQAIRHFQEIWGGAMITLAVGSHAGDLSMLRAVDLPLAIPRRDGAFRIPSKLFERRSSKPGPEGWCEVIEESLDRLGLPP